MCKTLYWAVRTHSAGKTMRSKRPGTNLSSDSSVTLGKSIHLAELYLLISYKLEGRSGARNNTCCIVLF